MPHIDKDLETLAKSCLPCLRVKQAPAPAPLHPWTWPSQPWQCVYVDFAGPFLNHSCRCLLKWALPLPRVPLMFFDMCLRRIGQFVASEFPQFLQQNGMKHCAPYHPATMGWQKGLWDPSNRLCLLQVYQGFLGSWRISCCATVPPTGRTPASLFLHRELCTRLYISSSLTVHAKCWMNKPNKFNSMTNTFEPES